MVVRVACDVAVPPIAAALAARGIQILSNVDDPNHADAALVSRAWPPAPTVARLRAAGWRGPVMLLVDRPEDVVAALDAGADDAALRLAPPAEIAARMAARVRGAATGPRIGPLSLDPMRRDGTRDGRVLGLLPREYRLLACLARQAGQTVPRAVLLEQVWGLRFDPGTKLLEVHVSRLRRRLDPPGAAPMLATERGVGYRLDPG